MTTQTMDDIKKQLRAASDRWNAAKTSSVAQTDGFVNLPDGAYLMKLNDASIGLSQTSGRLQITWNYTVMEGEKTGDSHRVYDGLDATDARDPLPYVLRTIRRFGVNIDVLKIDELPEVLLQLSALHPLIKCRLATSTKNGKTFQNTYVDQVMLADEAEGPASTEAPETQVDDDEAKPTFRIQDRVTFYPEDGVTQKSGVIKSFVNPTTCVIICAGKTYTRSTDEIEKAN
jgi:hypothetical protein